ncbi:MAG: hypothetical protein R3F20_06850 [Planctomycetota bacterium]
MEKFVLGLLVGAALGIGGWVLLGQGEDVVLPDASSHGAADEVDGGEEAGTAARRKTTVDLEPSRSAAGRKDESSPANPAPVSSEFTGVGEGVARAEDGTPIPGVEIVFSAVQNSAFDPETMLARLADPGEIDEWMRVARAEEVERRRLSRRALSGEDGSFRAEGLDPDGIFIVFARKPGWTFGQFGMVGPNWKVGIPLQVQGRRTAQLELDVVLPDGSAPARADVGQDGMRSPFETKPWTPAARTLEFPVGRVKLSVESGAFESGELALDLQPGPQTHRVVLHAKRTLTLRLRCDGELPPDLNARACALVDDEIVDVEEMTKRRLVYAARSSDASRIETSTLEARRYAVAIYAAQGSEPVTPIFYVDMRDGPVTKDVVVPALDLTEFILLRVFDARGRTITKPQLRLATNSFSGNSTHSVVGHPRGDGVLAVRIPKEAPYRPRRGHQLDPEVEPSHALEVKADGHGQVVIPIVAGQREATVRFQAAGELVVEVRGVPTERLAKTKVSVVEEGVSTSSARTSEAAGDGTFTFKGLQPGRYEILLEVPEDDGRWRTRCLGTRTVSVSSGANAATIVAGEPGRLRVLVGEGAKDVYVTIWNPSGGSSSRPAREGVAEFDELGHGSYRVIASGREDGTRYVVESVVVPDQTEVTLRKR